jgi:hypothetical protein
MVDEGYVWATEWDGARSTSDLFHHTGRFTTPGCRLHHATVTRTRENISILMWQPFVYSIFSVFIYSTPLFSRPDISVVCSITCL